MWDAERGLVFTRVPEGAVSGDLTVRVDGLDSVPFPFTVLPETFRQGGFVLGGQVFDELSPVEGAIVLMFFVDPDRPDCDPDGQLHDFGRTNAGGRFDLRHPGGDLFLLVLPPRAAAGPDAPSVSLAPAYRRFSNELTNRFFTAFLQEGVELSLRAVTGSPPLAVAGARVLAEGLAPDLAMTGPSGLATVYMLPEFPGPAEADVTVLGPLKSRLMLTGLHTTIPAALGDVSLTRGVFVAGQVTDGEGRPLTGADAGGFDGGDRLFDTVARRDGVWRGPVPPLDRYSVTLSTERADLADLRMCRTTHRPPITSPTPAWRPTAAATHPTTPTRPCSHRTVGWTRSCSWPAEKTTVPAEHATRPPRGTVPHLSWPGTRSREKGRTASCSGRRTLSFVLALPRMVPLPVRGTSPEQRPPLPSSPRWRQTVRALS